MPGYNLYISEKVNPELVEAFNRMKADGILSEFIVESCEVNLPLFLERKISESKALVKHYSALKDTFHSTKDKILGEKQQKVDEYLQTVPKNRDHKSLMGWLTSPASIRDWQAAGFKSAQEVIDTLGKKVET